MATTVLGTVLQNVRRSLLRHDDAGQTDGTLLECFITQQDEAAFEALVRRHGPMVLGVCRRVLRNEADAEDAFQATFLVLVRRAASIRPRGMVGNWLYGVAQNTARKAKAMNTRLRAKEREAGARPKPEAASEDWQQQQVLLDQELQALPDKYRAPIVLCDLEGKSIKEAARHLGCPPGTIGTRLARGRSMLARRLASRGLTLSGGVIATVLSQNGASASLPLPLVTSTVKAASLFAAGQAASGVVGAKVAALTEGVLKAMLLSKIKTATAVLLVIAVLGAGAAFQSYHTQAAEPTKVEQTEPGQTQGAEPAKVGQAEPVNEVKPNQAPAGVRNGPTIRDFLQRTDWIVTKVDVKNGTINVRWMDRMTLEDVVVPPTTRILVNGKTNQKLTDLKPGMYIELALSGDKATAFIIDAHGNNSDIFHLNAVDVKKRTINVHTSLGSVKVDLPVAENAKIVLRTMRDDKKIGEREGKLADLKAGMRVSVQLGADGGQGGRIIVKGIEAENLTDSANEKVSAAKP